MNYYESIQLSIDYIEAHLYEDINLKEVANEAHMSLSNYYRLFFSIVGYTVKEYIRLRRIHLAACDLLNSNIKIIDLTVKYGFTNATAFSRTFKRITGNNPSDYRNGKNPYIFNKISVIDKYFELQDSKLLDEYPDIKVLRFLDGFYAAVFRANSKTPENDAFTRMKKWFDDNDMLNINENYRVFGYDIPNSLKSDGIRAYEVAVTIPSDFQISDLDINKRYFEEGLYAVSVTTVGNIEEAWKRFKSWIDLSRYDMAVHQYFEEHDLNEGFLNRDFTNQNNLKINMYMPIVEKQKFLYEHCNIKNCRVAFYREYGDDSEEVAHNVWGVMLTWAKKHNLDSSNCQLYMYNHGFQKVKQFWHEIMITIDDDFTFTDNLVKVKHYKGGNYLSSETDLEHLTSSWMKVTQYLSANKIKRGKHQWLEEWVLDDWKFPAKQIKILCPL